MTSFSFPLEIKSREPAGPEAINLVQARVPGRYSVIVNTAKTGTASGTTTVPLFVAPAGSTVFDCVIDVLTGYDNTTTNLSVGTAGGVARIHTAVTVNTAGRRTYSPTGAQVSTNAIPFTADTTVVAVVSIDTSAVTAGNVLVHVQID
jgi:hypothetical protein